MHVSGAAAAEKVVASLLFDADRFDRFCDPVAKVAGADALAVAREEEGLLAGLQDELGAAFFQVDFEPVEGGFADW